MNDCTCADRTAVCPQHHDRPARITLADVLAGCMCGVIDFSKIDGGPPAIALAVSCPVHGAPAFRRGQPS